MGQRISEPGKDGTGSELWFCADGTGAQCRAEVQHPVATVVIAVAISEGIHEGGKGSIFAEHAMAASGVD